MNNEIMQSKVQRLQIKKPQGRIFYIICGYSSGKRFRFLLSLLNKLGKVTLFWPFLSGKSLQFSGKYSPLGLMLVLKIIFNHSFYLVTYVASRNISYWIVKIKDIVILTSLEVHLAHYVTCT